MFGARCTETTPTIFHPIFRMTPITSCDWWLVWECTWKLNLARKAPLQIHVSLPLRTISCFFQPRLKSPATLSGDPCKIFIKTTQEILCGLRTCCKIGQCNTLAHGSKREAKTNLNSQILLRSHDMSRVSSNTKGKTNIGSASHSLNLTFWLLKDFFKPGKIFIAVTGYLCVGPFSAR